MSAGSVIFRGAELRHFDVRTPKEGGQFLRLHFAAAISEPVCGHFDWSVPDGILNAQLTGNLPACSGLALTPNDKTLATQGISVECYEVGDFRAVAEKDDEGDVTGHYLRFIVRSKLTPESLVTVGNYYMVVGQAQAQLKVAYSAQEQLIDKPTVIDGKSAAAGEKDEDDDRQIPIEESLTGPALASHREMQAKAGTNRKKVVQ